MRWNRLLPIGGALSAARYVEAGTEQAWVVATDMVQEAVAKLGRAVNVAWRPEAPDPRDGG